MRILEFTISPITSRITGRGVDVRQAKRARRLLPGDRSTAWLGVIPLRLRDRYRDLPD